MTAGIYLLCAATCLVCAVLLLRGYRRSGVRLLLWSGICFLFMMLENVVGYVDVAVIPELSLVVWRKLPGLLAISVLLFGLIWESK
jgi:hypothetical protein